MGKQPSTIGRNRSLRYTSKLSNRGCSSVCRVSDNLLTSVEKSCRSSGNSGQNMSFKGGERGWVVLLADMTAWGFPRSGAGSVPGRAGGEKA